MIRSCASAKNISFQDAGMCFMRADFVHERDMLHQLAGAVADRQDRSHATIFRPIRCSWYFPRIWATWAPHRSRAARRSARNSWRW